MDKDNLIEQINTFLDDSPFEDEEISFWKENLPKMHEKELEELFRLLKEKLRIITNANDVFIKIAEDTLIERDKRKSMLPTKASIVDMQINDLAEIFKGSELVERLKDEGTNFLVELDTYFSNASLAGENAIEEFDILIKSLFKNEDTLNSVSNLKIADCLKFYDGYKDKIGRKSIDRINFVSNGEKVKKLNQEEKRFLLKLLKLYDFLLDPDSVGEEVEIRMTTKNINSRDDSYRSNDKEIINNVLSKWRSNQEMRYSGQNKSDFNSSICSLVDGKFRQSADMEQLIVTALKLNKINPEIMAWKGIRFLGGEGVDGKFRVHAAGLNYIIGNYGTFDKQIESSRLSRWNGLKLTEDENMKIMRESANTLGSAQRAGYEKFLNKLEDYGKKLRGGMGDFAESVSKVGEAIDRSRSL